MEEKSKKEATLSLRFAREKGDIEDFVKEHEADLKGDLEKLDSVIKASTSANVANSDSTPPED